MSPELIAYLKENKWKRFCGGWDLTLNSECHATINIKDSRFFYNEDCPDVRMPIEDYFKPVSFESEEDLIEFLKKKKLTNWPGSDIIITDITMRGMRH